MISRFPFTGNVNSKYGAPMGRGQVAITELEGRLYLRRVPLDNGGYDPGGAYWGHPNNLFCCWDVSSRAFYIRAENRQTALDKLKVIASAQETPMTLRFWVGD